MHDEGNDAQSDGGGGPLAGVERHPWCGARHGVEGGGAEAVDGEARDHDRCQRLPDQGVECGDGHLLGPVRVVLAQAAGHALGLVVSVGQHVGGGDAVAQPHPAHAHQGAEGLANLIN